MDVRAKQPAPAPPAAGELVVQSGRQAGARRPLQLPLTFIGQAPGCDIRLNVPGIAPLHCLIAHTAGGFVLRDLDSGTLLNGVPVTVQPLHDGDELTIGSFQFCLHLPPGAIENHPEEKAGLRIQAAAVAAQQAALLDEEVRLVQQRGTLEQQESQLAAHLDEKRRKLQELTEHAQSARAALRQERTAYQEHVEKATHDLSAAQRELVEGRQQLDAERQRLRVLRRRLQQRADRQLQTDRKLLQQREGEVAAGQSQLEAASASGCGRIGCASTARANWAGASWKTHGSSSSASSSSGASGWPRNRRQRGGSARNWRCTRRW